MITKRGVFLSIEGLDCSGKTTVREHLSRRFPNSLITREPGGCPLSETLRGIILENAGAMDSRTETMLFYAARIEHCERTIKPALAEGRMVICDRYYDSSLAYQGALNEGFVYHLHNALLDVDAMLVPDVTILLNISVETYIRRKNARGVVKGEEINGIEARDIEFFSALRSRFLDQAEKEPERFIVIDAEPDSAMVCSNTEAALLAWLSNLYT